MSRSRLELLRSQKDGQLFLRQVSASCHDARAGQVIVLLWERVTFHIPIQFYLGRQNTVQSLRLKVERCYTHACLVGKGLNS